MVKKNTTIHLFPDIFALTNISYKPGHSMQMKSICISSVQREKKTICEALDEKRA